MHGAKGRYAIGNDTSTKLALSWRNGPGLNVLGQWRTTERDRQNPEGIANTLLDLPLKWRVRQKPHGIGTMGRKSIN